MNIFESLNNTSGKMGDAGEIYVKKSTEYVKLKVFQQITISVSMVAKALLIGGLFAIGLLFAALAAALAIGEWLGNQALGYLVVAGVFLILTLIIYLARSVIDNMIIKRFSSKFFDS
ncbi:hypothetical protein BZARG_718 [Bizionia argentinensis JUB59]|uniref:Phage holin family protein n=1 Tax=Bizionia argentinensis JUB59 TaxID=1046627 RepID=G2EB35_9FLAO|nr:hypothetical protein [Bizionia argentinensis]EGV44395.1 hypothetical protein BZARG_718 [Bizionia argentinensis JUB59]